MSILRYLAITANTKIDADKINIPAISANDVLVGGLNILYTVAGVVAVIAIIIAGFKYVTSMGDSAAVTKAKNTIMYAVVGLVVVIMAFTVTWFIIGRFS